MVSYASLIDQGWCPIWTGARPGINANKIHVKLALGSRRIWKSIHVTTTVRGDSKVLIKQTAEYPGSAANYYPDSSQQGLARMAAISGIAPFCAPGYSIGSYINRPSMLKIAGLDVEQSIMYRGGDFPLAHDPIISIAIATWDGRYFCRYSTGYHDHRKLHYSGGYDVARLATSEDVACWAIDWLVDNCPDFVCIHNGYAYDVRVIATHCRREYSQYFRDVSLGAKDRGMDLEIPGVTMVDTFRYIDKLHRRDYDSISLDAIAIKTLGMQKSQQPSLSIEYGAVVDMTDILYYNIHDATLHVLIAESTGCISELICMPAVFKCPINDVTRYITGTMASTMIASYAALTNRVMDWSPEPIDMPRYAGGFVMKPLIGISDNVCTVDVASMYPNLMIDANVSIETVTMRRRDDPFARSRDTVNWDKEAITVRTGDYEISTDLRPIGIVPEVVKLLIDMRKDAGKSTELGLALKIAANSFYGALGACSSRLQSRGGAALITCIGRYIIGSAAALADSFGFTPIYGDTDSVFLSARPDTEITVPQFLAVFHHILSLTPFKRVRLELDREYVRIIHVKPKMYYGCYRKADGDLAFDAKGLAAVRKDRPLIAQRLVAKVGQMLCTGNRNTLPSEVSMVVAETVFRIRMGKCSLIEQCSQRRRGGMTNYVYSGVDGKEHWIRADRAEAAKVDVSTKWLERAVSNAIAPLVSASGLPPVEVMLSYAERIGGL